MGGGAGEGERGGLFDKHIHKPVFAGSMRRCRRRRSVCPLRQAPARAADRVAVQRVSSDWPVPPPHSGVCAHISDGRSPVAAGQPPTRSSAPPPTPPPSPRRGVHAAAEPSRPPGAPAPLAVCQHARRRWVITPRQTAAQQQAVLPAHAIAVTHPPGGLPPLVCCVGRRSSSPTDAAAAAVLADYDDEERERVRERERQTDSEWSVAVGTARRWPRRCGLA